MLFIRPIIFIVTLAFSFLLSQDLDGIPKVREGFYELATSFVEKDPVQEVSNSENVSKYLSPQYWKYGVIVVGMFSGLFTASISGALMLGFLGGILFSPEISVIMYQSSNELITRCA